MKTEYIYPVYLPSCIQLTPFSLRQPKNNNKKNKKRSSEKIINQFFDKSCKIQSIFQKIEQNCKNGNPTRFQSSSITNDHRHFDLLCSLEMIDFTKFRSSIMN